MRITKTLATQIAEAMLAPKKEALEGQKTKLSEFITEAHLKTVPSVVMEAFKSHPEWVETSIGLKITNEGFGWEQFRCTSKVPSNDGWTTISSDDAKKVRKMSDKLDDDRKKYNSLKHDLEAALFALRTYKNITENLPEAVPHLPKLSENTGLMVDLSSLRKRIA